MVMSGWYVSIRVLILFSKQDANADSSDRCEQNKSHSSPSSKHESSAVLIDCCISCDASPGPMNTISCRRSPTVVELVNSSWLASSKSEIIASVASVGHYVTNIMNGLMI